VDRVVMAQRRRDMRCMVGSCIGVHLVAAIESVMQVRITIVGKGAHQGRTRSARGGGRRGPYK